MKQYKKKPGRTICNISGLDNIVVSPVLTAGQLGFLGSFQRDAVVER